MNPAPPFPRFRPAASAAVLTVFLALPSHNLSACAVCFGAPGSDLSESMSLSVLFMIGVTAVMLSGLGFFIHTIHRRSREAGPPPRVDEFGADILPDPKA